MTELRKLAKNCEFTDTDKEILSQIIQNCRSNQLRRRALRESDKGLEDIIQLGRAMELSDTQAQAMERTETINKVSKFVQKEKPQQRTKQRYTRLGEAHKSNSQCWNCGGQFPHRDKQCPAKHSTCHHCKKKGHFKKMCRSMRRNTDSVKAVNKESDSDSDSYCYGIKLLNLNNVNSIKGPCVTVKLNGVSTKLLIDSGSSVNILDEFDYGKIGKPLLLKKCSKGKLIPYGGGESIKVSYRYV